jgi:oligoendopeptidase F
MIFRKNLGRTLRKKAFFSWKDILGKKRTTAAKTSETRIMESRPRVLI